MTLQQRDAHAIRITNWVRQFGIEGVRKHREAIDKGLSKINFKLLITRDLQGNKIERINLGVKDTSDFYSRWEEISFGNALFYPDNYHEDVR